MRLAAAIGAVALLLSACSAPGSAVQPSPTPSVMVLDDGALTITPMPDASSSVTPEQVRQDLALSSDQTVQKLGALTLGLVRWDPGIWVKQPNIAQDRLAWVQFWQDKTDQMGDDERHYCSGAATGIFGTQPTPARVSSPSRQHALVVDASTGAAAIYDGAGPSACLVYEAPFAFPAERKESVPWTSLGGGRARVALPPCAVSQGGWRDTPTTFRALAARGFGPCAGGPTSAVVSGYTKVLPTGHSPLGPLCARIAKGVPLPRPAACVN